MSDTEKALLQLNRAKIAIRMAQEHFKAAGANTTITGTLDTIAELTEDLTGYATQEYKAAPVSADQYDIEDTDE